MGEEKGVAGGVDDTYWQNSDVGKLDFNFDTPDTGHKREYISKHSLNAPSKSPTPTQGNLDLSVAVPTAPHLDLKQSSRHVINQHRCSSNSINSKKSSNSFSNLSILSQTPSFFKERVVKRSSQLGKFITNTIITPTASNSNISNSLGFMPRQNHNLSFSSSINEEAASSVDAPLSHSLTHQHNVQAFHVNKFTSIHINVVNQMILGEDVSKINLNPFKSIKDKFCLLDAAIFRCDSQVLFQIIHFIYNTLSLTLLMEEMQKRPIAMSHFLKYLTCIKGNNSTEQTLYLEVLSLSKEDKGNAIFYENIKNIFNANTLKPFEKFIQEMSALSKNGLFRNIVTDPDDLAYLSEYASLLKCQFTLDALMNRFDGDVQKSFKPLLPLNDSVKFASLVDTIILIDALQHTKVTLSSFSSISISTLVQEHRLPDKQYKIAMIFSKILQENWSEIEKIVQKSDNLFAFPHGRSVISFETVVELLTSANVSPLVMERFRHLVQSKKVRDGRTFETL